MARLERITQIETPESAPRYELRVRRHGPVGTEYEIWQLPAIATPQVGLCDYVSRAFAGATSNWLNTGC